MSYGVEFKSEATIELKAFTSMIQERILRKVYWLIFATDDRPSTAAGIADRSPTSPL